MLLPLILLPRTIKGAVTLNNQNIKPAFFLCRLLGKLLNTESICQENWWLASVRLPHMCPACPELHKETAGEQENREVGVGLVRIIRQATGMLIGFLTFNLLFKSGFFSLSILHLGSDNSLGMKRHSVSLASNH